ncbi:MAG: 50S ribosomal protein L30 [Synergistaceae bacterium]|jgi:large subunit ribosomal protein L30|nr:50S ribosomal protein L30 [Synergistaceae bacterium]
MAKIKVTLKKSTIGRPDIQGRTVRALGLHRIGETVEHDDTPQVRGMVRSVIHLVEWTQSGQEGVNGHESS